MTECKFEPDVAELRCSYCDRLTTERGTCEDETFCDACREDWENDPYIGKQRVAELMVGMAEKNYSFKVSYMPKRAMHAAFGDYTVCGARGGPHPMTYDVKKVTCKRCIRKLVLR